MKRLFFAIALTLTALLAGQANAQQKTIVETAVAAGSFETLVAAVKAAGLVDTLNGHTEFTVFAPTDAAFEHVDHETLQALLQPENKDQLTSILTYHVVPGRVNARDAYSLNSAPTVNGQQLPLNFRGEALQVGEATITTTDIQCSNGVIHVIDAVLMPGQDSIPAVAKSAGQFNTLLAAVGAADLGEVLSGPGPFTVFAPTDQAFANLPEGTVENLLKPENKQQLIDLLKYHVVSGRVYDNDAVKARRASTLLGRGVDIELDAGGLMVNDARVVAKNIDASNGVVHVIDSVLIPSAMNGRHVMTLLEETIARGAPVFNAGQHDRCAEMYMEALDSIMASGIEHADDHTMKLVSDTLDRARRTHSMPDRAWALRDGIRNLYVRLQDMPENMPAQIRTSRQ